MNGNRWPLVMRTLTLPRKLSEAHVHYRVQVARQPVVAVSKANAVYVNNAKLAQVTGPPRYFILIAHQRNFSIPGLLAPPLQRFPCAPTAVMTPEFL